MKCEDRWYLDPTTCTCSPFLPKPPCNVECDPRLFLDPETCECTPEQPGFAKCKEVPCSRGQYFDQKLCSCLWDVKPVCNLRCDVGWQLDTERCECTPPVKGRCDFISDCNGGSWDPVNCYCIPPQPPSTPEPIRDPKPANPCEFMTCSPGWIMDLTTCLCMQDNQQ